MGGRGSRSSGGGRMGGDAGLNPADIVGTRDMISQRHTNPDVDEALTAFYNVYQEYGIAGTGTIQTATLKGRGANALAYYDGENIAFNESYVNSAKMNAAYDSCVKSGFHPSRGKKSGLEAVAAHELGHELTDAVGKKMGLSGFAQIGTAATRIVNEARKKTKHRGVVQMAKKISGYATHSNAEAIAEAFADVYCNGKKAKAESRAIVDVMNSYLK